MSKSRIAENDSHLKRGAKKEKTYFKNNFGCAFVLVLLIGAVGGKVYFDVKTAVTKAYVNPPTQMTSVSLKEGGVYDGHSWNK